MANTPSGEHQAILEGVSWLWGLVRFVYFKENVLWAEVGVLNGAKLGLGLCQVIPHVHFEHVGPWINDLGDFVPLFICIFFSPLLFFCRFLWDIRTLIVEHYLNMDSR